MTSRQKALVASSPSIALLVVALVWNAVDGHWVDRAVRKLSLWSS